MVEINCPISIVSVIFRCSHREIVEVCVEAVLSRREVDRCEHTADFDERVGLITCERLHSVSRPRMRPPCREAHGFLTH